MNEAEFNAMDDNERFNRVLQGTFYYPSVHKPNLASQKNYGGLPVFMVTLGLDKKNQKLAEEYGLKILEPNDAIPQPHVRIKRKVKAGVDPNSVKPSVLDPTQKTIPSSVLIGNGSKGRVKFATYWPPNGEKYGAGTTFFKMVVDELVEFKPDPDSDNRIDADLGVKEGGFSIEAHLANAPLEDTANDEEVSGKAPKKKAVASGSIFDE